MKGNKNKKVGGVLLYAGYGLITVSIIRLITLSLNCSALIMVKPAF